MTTIFQRLEDFQRPSAMTVFTFVMVSYFLVTAGIAYDIINEPPAVGGHPDPVTGKVKPVTFMPYRINGQYIIEGLSGGFLYTLGGLGLIMLDKAHGRNLDKSQRVLLFGAGGFCVFIAYCGCMLFIRIKMPGYLR